MVILVKLGGAAITDKSAEEPTEHPSGIDACLRMMESFHSRGQEVVAAHGAGSFGHPVAQATRAAEGWKSAEEPQKRRAGWCLTRANVDRLSATLGQRFTEAGVPVAIVPPGSFGMKGENHHVPWFDAISQFLSEGIVPLLRGDCVLDASKGGTIMSADDVLVDASRSRIGDFAVFVTGAEGILESPEPGARLAADIAVDASSGFSVVRWAPEKGATHDGKIVPSVIESQELPQGGKGGVDVADSADVTGGILGKMRAAANFCFMGLAVAIVAPTEEGAIALSQGRPWRGTLIRSCA